MKSKESNINTFVLSLFCYGYCAICINECVYFSIFAGLKRASLGI